MFKLTDAFGHPAYDAGVKRAACRALDDKGACFSVYYDGKAIFVRPSEAAPPPNALLVCIAQYWSGNEVQLRFAGANSEFISMTGASD